MSPCNQFELPRRIFFDSYQNATNDAAPEQEQHRASVGQFECRLGGARSASLWVVAKIALRRRHFCEAATTTAQEGQGCIGVGNKCSTDRRRRPCVNSAPKACI